ncbi:MAG: hypothetical protein QOD24_4652 [Solirubrobacteraceae bacterium]|jgi:hypothetical protein|nr:hypothetical protein [Solirubrobacteraceae bacterium]
MFRRLAQRSDVDLAKSGPLVFDLHPMQLARFLEEAWISATNAQPRLLEAPTGMEVPALLREQEATSHIDLPGLLVGAAPTDLLWDQLIYAYLVENTRAYEIFRRVLEEFAYGERLGTPTDATQRWLRTTEQLLYSAEAPFQIYSLTSWIRNDHRATRRNAYFRMFGMDLNHGTDDGRPYPYPRAAASNTEFVVTWEEFLREVWRGIENFTNQSGPSPTDDAAIARLARTLDDMMRVRREGGNLGRDELWHVSMLSWLHLTVSFDSPLVLDLEAQGNSAEDRLLKIGERVGLPAHSRSGEYFRLADDMSFILRLIELAQFNTTAGAKLLYEKSSTDPKAFDAMIAIIRDWSMATGRDMKARRVSLTAPQSRPIRPAARPIVPTAPNGRANVTRETLPL